MSRDECKQVVGRTGCILFGAAVVFAIAGIANLFWLVNFQGEPEKCVGFPETACLDVCSCKWTRKTCLRRKGAGDTEGLSPDCRAYLDSIVTSLTVLWSCVGILLLLGSIMCCVECHVNYAPRLPHPAVSVVPDAPIENNDA